MSVLIEALSLVIPKFQLAIAFPGGPDAFGQAMLDLARPPRFVTMLDEHLVSVSFYDSAHLEPAEQLLASHGIVHVDDETRKTVDFACVDQKFGPTMPCDWLEWRTHRDGFTYAWLAGTQPGDMSVPDGWTPQQSRDLVRADEREVSTDLFHLASEDGFETWLDTSTGRQITSLAHREAAEPPEESCVVSPESISTEDVIEELDRQLTSGKPIGKSRRPLIEVVRTVLDEEKWQYAVDGETVTWQLAGPHTTWDCALITNQQNERVHCFVRPPARVPKAYRIAVAEYMTRVNYEQALGAFDMDFADGEIRYRVAVDVEGGRLGPVMVRTMLRTALLVFDHHYPGIMRVLYAGMTPAEALASLKEGAA